MPFLLCTSEICPPFNADLDYLQLVIAKSDLFVVRELHKTEFDYVLEVYYFPSSTN
jgi:hypothetical protein